MKRVISGIRNNWVLLLILVVGLGLRVWGINFGLPDFFPHTDETFAWSKAINFFHPEARPAPFVTILHLWGWVLYTGLSFFKVVFTLSVDSELTLAEFMWWARLTSVLLSTGSMLMVYLIARRLFKGKKGKEVGLMAALLLSVSFIDVQVAHYFRQDPYVQFFGLLLVYAYLKARKKIYWWVFLLGILGAVRITGWFYGGLILGDYWFRSRISVRKKFISLVSLGLILGLGLLVGHPDAWGERFDDYFKAYFNFYSKTGTVGGITGYSAGNIPNYVWYAKYLWHTGLGWGAVVLLIGAMVWSVKNAKQLWKNPSRRFYLFMVGLVVIYFVFLSLLSIRMDRYLVVITPLLFIIVAYFIFVISEKWLSKKNGWLRWLFMGMLVVWPLLRAGLFVYGIGQVGTREEARDWIVDNYTRDDLIVSSGSANIITQNLRKVGYDKSLSFYPIDKYDELDALLSRFSVDSGVFIISSKDYRVCENYQKFSQMGSCWLAYQQVKSNFKLVKQFSRKWFSSELFGLDELEISSTVNSYHNPVIEVYLFN